MEARLFDDESRSASPAPRETARSALRRALRMDTLKGQLAAGGLMALVLGIGITMATLNSVAERELLLVAQHREQAEAARIAAVIGRRVADMQRALRVGAEEIDTEMLRQPQRLRTHLDGKPLLRSLFAGIAVTAADGRMLLYYDGGGARFPDLHIADRPYFRRTVDDRVPVISDPVPGRISDEPIVILTQPIVERGGAVAGVLSGTLRLASHDLLEELTEARSSDAQTLVVITDGAGRVLAHPQRPRLVESVTREPRLAAAFARWQADGRPLLDRPATWTAGADVIAAAGESSTGWHVWRVASTSALTAPLVAARRQAVLIAVLLVALLCGALWIYLSRQLRPLRALEERAAALMRGDESARWPEAEGEIGALARTLRHVWAERAQVESFNVQVLGKLSSVMAAAPVGLAFTRDRRYELVSAEMCRMLGRSEANLIGQSGEVIFASHDDYLALGPQVAAAFAENRPYHGEWRLKRADGSSFWARLQARPVLAGDTESATIWSLHDIDEQVDHRNKLQHAATHDALTGLLNRKGFEYALAEALVADGTSTLVMIDLDRFKPINDSAGHAAGDAMLKAVAEVLARQVRASDCAGRLGGDEFALLLRGCESTRAALIAEKARQAIHALQLPWKGHHFSVGASLGVCERSPAFAEVAEWMRTADEACYDAKAAGRGNVRMAGAPTVVPLVVQAI